MILAVRTLQIIAISDKIIFNLFISVRSINQKNKLSYTNSTKPGRGMFAFIVNFTGEESLDCENWRVKIDQISVF